MRKAITFTQNTMRFCDDDAALKKMSDEIIKCTAVLNVARAPILPTPTITVSQLLCSILANQAAIEAASL